jgi:hypothetical protein
LNKTAYAALLVALVGVSLILIALPPAGGQLGLNILQVQPTEAAARQTVNVQGTINTSNGPYRLFLDNDTAGQHDEPNGKQQFYS